jgi:hypothetical protein
LKQGDALSPLLFNFALEYAISRVQGQVADTGFESKELKLFETRGKEFFHFFMSEVMALIAVNQFVLCAACLTARRLSS